MNTSSTESILPALPKSETDAYQLEEEYVHQVYNEIAHTFSDSRYRPWPHVAEFLRTFTSGSFVLDIGCGNGKYMNLRNDLFMVEKKRIDFDLISFVTIV
jgi:ubiquinone/menaquinone biosynthesis C-methylase UbiE